MKTETKAQSQTFRLHFNEPFRITKYKNYHPFMDFRAKSINEAFKRLEAIFRSSTHEYTNEEEIIVDRWEVIQSEPPVLFSNTSQKKPYQGKA